MGSGPRRAPCGAALAFRARSRGTGGTQAKELGEELNPYRDVTTYNNFYEFGTQKEDPARNAGDFRPRPWTVRIEGHVNKPGDYQLEDFIGPSNMEDRVYRMRCVEAWSVVVPWRGFPLSDVITRAAPPGAAAPT